jgi:antitoxin VapB
LALNIRDKEVDRLATELAKATRTTKTQAVKLALRHELDQAARKDSLGDRLRPMQERILGLRETGMPADKSFFDDLNGEA